MIGRLIQRTLAAALVVSMVTACGGGDASLTRQAPTTTVTSTTTSQETATSTTTPRPQLPDAPEGPQIVGSARGPYEVASVDDSVSLTLSGYGRVQLVPLYSAAQLDEANKAGLVKLLQGIEVWVQAEPTRTRASDGRTPVHVWLSDGRLLAWVMLREGYGVPGGWSGHLYETELRAAYNAAKTEDRGTWASTTTTTEPLPPTVTYEVSGIGTALVTYFSSGFNQQQETVTLPWSYTTEAHVSTPVITAQLDGTGRIGCRILRSDETVAEASSNGQYVVVTCSEG